MSKYKTCTKCKLEKPLSLFSRDKYKKSGLVSQCKSCISQRNKETRARGKQLLSQLSIEQREAKKAHSRANYLKNKDKLRANNRKWAKENPEKRKEIDRRYRANNREKNRQRMMEYRAKNPQIRKEWALRNPEKQKLLYTAHSLKRRAVKKYLVTREEIQALYSKPCLYCGNKSEIQIDHIIPVSRDGEHRIGNLTSACSTCNLDKRAMFIMEWKLKRIKRGHQR